MFDARNRPRGPAAPRTNDPTDGVLLVDKPSGPTSHDVVDALRRKLGLKKVGHGGTLDPMATGLLIVLTGKGTKLSSLFLSSDKIYEGTLRLGVATNTQDAEGEVISQADFASVTRDQLVAEMAKRTGDLMQAPPMVSAAKVDGVPLYKLARKGQTVERKPRLIHVYEYQLIDFRPPDADFVMRCTKGTYVRTLCAEVGESLGCGAHLAALRRTASGTLKIADAAPLATLMELPRQAVLERILPLSRFLRPGM